jgi:hypothetical protein
MSDSLFTLRRSHYLPSCSKRRKTHVQCCVGYAFKCIATREAHLPVSRRGNSKLSSALERDYSFETTPRTNCWEVQGLCSQERLLTRNVSLRGVGSSIPSARKNSGILLSELFIGKFGVTVIFLLFGLYSEVYRIWLRQLRV